MAEDKQRDWVDTVSKLLIPIVIFFAGFWFSYQKDRNDRENQRFERESGILKLAASANQAERTLGLKIIEIQLGQGKFSPEMVPVVQAISQGPPSDTSTVTALNILETAAKKDPAIEQILQVQKTQPPAVYLQIARDDQRGEAGDLRASLQGAGFVVPGVELVSRGTTNTYVRFFSAGDKTEAEKVLAIMRGMGFNAGIQDFSRNQGKVNPGQLEVWIGEKEGPLSKPVSTTNR